MPCGRGTISSNTRRNGSGNPHYSQRRVPGRNKDQFFSDFERQVAEIESRNAERRCVVFTILQLHPDHSARYPPPPLLTSFEGENGQALLNTASPPETESQNLYQQPVFFLHFNFANEAALAITESSKSETGITGCNSYHGSSKDLPNGMVSAISDSRTSATSNNSAKLGDATLSAAVSDFLVVAPVGGKNMHRRKGKKKRKQNKPSSHNKSSVSLNQHEDGADSVLISDVTSSDTEVSSHMLETNLSFEDTTSYSSSGKEFFDDSPESDYHDSPVATPSQSSNLDMKNPATSSQEFSSECSEESNSGNSSDISGITLANFGVAAGSSALNSWNSDNSGNTSDTETTPAAKTQQLDSSSKSKDYNCSTGMESADHSFQTAEVSVTCNSCDQVHCHSVGDNNDGFCLVLSKKRTSRMRKMSLFGTLNEGNPLVSSMRWHTGNGTFLLSSDHGVHSKQMLKAKLRQDLPLIQQCWKKASDCRSSDEIDKFTLEEPDSKVFCFADKNSSDDIKNSSIDIAEATQNSAEGTNVINTKNSNLQEEEACFMHPVKHEADENTEELCIPVFDGSSVSVSHSSAVIRKTTNNHNDESELQIVIDAVDDASNTATTSSDVNELLYILIDAVDDAYNAQVAMEDANRLAGRHIADIESFISSAAPVVNQPLCSSSCSICLGQRIINPLHCDHLTSNISLSSIWRWYEQPGTYGLEMRAFDSVNSRRFHNGSLEFSAFFVPQLSAIQLFRQSRDNYEKSCMDKQSGWKTMHAASSSQCSQLSSLKDGELVFEYFESEQPPSRCPFFKKINDLVRGINLSNSQSYGNPQMLEKLKLGDLHPASWYAVAWYPIYRIPQGSLRAAFLTYHSLGKLVRGTCSIEKALSVVPIICPVVGLQSYNDKGEFWFQMRSLDENNELGSSSEGPANVRRSELLQERLRTLKHASSVMARAQVLKGNQKVANQHPDYEFFLSRS